LTAEEENNADQELMPEKGGKLRLVVHVVLISAGWIVFGYFWFTVIRRGWYGRGIPVALIAMAMFSVLLVILISIWIRHNKNIARENRRKSAPSVEDNAFIGDKTGLELVFEDIFELKRAEVIDIEIDGGRKIIRPGSAGDTETGQEE